MKRLFLLLALLFLPALVQAQTVAYIQPSGSNTAPYDTWTKARTCLPAGTAAVRDTTYYIASGDYRGCGGASLIDLSTANSTTKTITFKKAIASDHGAAVDWDAAFGTGQAIFQPVRFQHDYWIIDGNCRTKATAGGTQGIKFDIHKPADAGYYLTGNDISIVSAGRHGSNVGASNTQFYCIESYGSYVAAITGAVRTGGVATYTTAAPHIFTAGVHVYVSGMTDSSFNIGGSGGALIVATPTSTTFTVSQALGDATSGVLSWAQASQDNPDEFGIQFLAGTPIESNNYLGYSAIWHTGSSPITVNNNTGFIAEYNWIGKDDCAGNTHTEGFEIKGTDTSTTYRYNIQEDICGTAGIAFLSGVTSSNPAIYGSVFFRPSVSTQGNGYDNAVVAVLSTSIVTGIMRLYNNTVVNENQSAAVPTPFYLSTGGIANVADLEIANWYFDNTSNVNLTSNSSGVCTYAQVTVCHADYNTYANGSTATNDNSLHKQSLGAGTTLLTSFLSKNFHLTGATTAGLTLASPFNLDPDGVTRAVDGVWDRGAYEFNSGAATAPLVSITPNPLDFGNVTNGATSGAQLLTLSNPGTATLTITGIAVSDVVNHTGQSAQFTVTGDGTGGKCNIAGGTLAVSASCTVSVTFSPNAVASFAAQLSYTTNAASSVDQIPLSGIGVAAPGGGAPTGVPVTGFVY